MNLCAFSVITLHSFLIFCIKSWNWSYTWNEDKLHLLMFHSVHISYIAVDIHGDRSHDSFLTLDISSIHSSSQWDQWWVLLYIYNNYIFKWSNVNKKYSNVALCVVHYFYCMIKMVLHEVKLSTILFFHYARKSFYDAKCNICFVIYLLYLFEENMQTKNIEF